ncbi:MAG TPA: hypothetical protein VMH04_01005 [Candidatus Solibacter sp.]|nr:hypothetical protein [Candidatus Solibacter sp.]
MSANHFLLTKWYLDCVAENGDTLILYVADLRWSGLSFHYGSVLTVLEGKVACASSVRSSPLFAVTDQFITVRQPSLKVDGTWEALRPAIRTTPFQNLNGFVDWHCLQPMSRVGLVFRGRTKISGLGYAECLTLSILPWKLPLSTLHWGRYLSAEHAIVWIDWQGQAQYRSVLCNGEEMQATSITESEIVLSDPGARLELDRGLVLRQGRLGDTVFPAISRLTDLLPRPMLSVDECKWRSRGVFHTSSGESSGWAIHEVVKWQH